MEGGRQRGRKNRGGVEDSTKLGFCQIHVPTEGEKGWGVWGKGREKKISAGREEGVRESKKKLGGQWRNGILSGRKKRKGGKTTMGVP